MLELIIAGAAVFTAFATYKAYKGPVTANDAAAAQASQAAQAQVQNGVSAITQVGTQAGQIAASISAESQSQKDQFSKNLLTLAGGAATTGAVTAMTSVGGAAAGATIAGVTFGIGAAVGIALMLWSKHKARIKGAKTENAGWNSIATAYKETISGIFDAFNAGKLTPDQTVAELNSLRDLIHQDGLQFNHMPGVNWSGSHNSIGDTTQKYGSVKCDKHCTVGCCLYNNIVGPSVNNAVALMQGRPYFNGFNNTAGDGKTMTIPTSASSKYGFSGMAGFTLTKGR